MKVAYIFESAYAREILENMIVPQMEKGIHGADVVGMMFFNDTTFMLMEGSDLANRLAALAKKTGMLLQACGGCCSNREIDDKLIPPAKTGCFPDLFAALSAAGADQIITL